MGESLGVADAIIMAASSQVMESRAVSGAPQRLPNGQLVAGTGALNPGGSTQGARRKIQAHFLNDLLADYKVGGATAIACARLSDPVAYIKVVASLLPKEVEVKGPLEGMSDDELLQFLDRLRGAITAREAGGGMGAAAIAPPVE